MANDNAINDNKIHASTYNLIFDDKDGNGFIGLGEGAEMEVFSPKGEALSPDDVRLKQFKKNVDFIAGPKGFRFGSVKNYIERMQGDKIDYKNRVSLANAREKAFQRAEAAAAEGNQQGADIFSRQGEELAKNLTKLPEVSEKDAKDLTDRCVKRGKYIRGGALINLAIANIKKCEWDKLNAVLKTIPNPSDLLYGQPLEKELVTELTARINGYARGNHFQDWGKVLRSVELLQKAGVFEKSLDLRDLYVSLSKLQEGLEKNESYFTAADFNQLGNAAKTLRQSLAPQNQLNDPTPVANK